MSEALRIGRVAVPECELTSVESIDSSAGGISIKGRFPTNNAKLAAALRAALIGLESNQDEPWVPLTYEADHSLDGWYQVAGVSVGVGSGGLPIGWWEFSLELDAGENSGTPQWEATVQGALRPNQHSWAASSAVPWYAVPSAATSFTWADPNTDTQVLVDTASGQVAKRRGTSSTFSGFPTWVVPPAAHYAGAALIEQRVGDSGIWVPVVGRRTFGPIDSGGWRVGNGLMRVTYEGGDLLMFERFTSGYGWEGASFRVGGISRFGSPSIMRNDPSSVVMLVDAVGQSGYGSRSVTFAARRGDTWARMSTTSNSVTTPALTPAEAETWSNASGYAQGPVVGSGSGSRWVMASTYLWTLPAGGGIASNAGNLGAGWNVGVGMASTAVLGEYKSTQNDRLAFIRR